MQWLNRKRLSRGLLAILSILVGAYLTLPVTDLAPRPQELWTDKVAIRIERDPEVFLADLPLRWARFEYVFDQAPAQLTRPPFLCHHRYTWASAQSGVDAGRTTVRVSIEGRDAKRTVVLRQFRVSIHSRRRPARGTHVACPVGGAEASVRKLAIDLDKEAVCFLNRDGACVRRIRPFTLREGEIEFFDITATTQRCHCEWSVELDYSVGGDEETVSIMDDDGEPFETTAITRARTFSFAGRRWYPGEHLGAPRQGSAVSKAVPPLALE